MSIHPRHILSLLLAPFLLGCSSDSGGYKSEEEEQPQSTEPLRFGALAVSTPLPSTRTSSTEKSLESGFLVSTYKNFGILGSQQTVMNHYEVRYDYNGWTGKSKWESVGNTTDGYYQTQYEKYWDFSSTAYRFHAIAPCPKPTDRATSLLNGFTVTDKELRINTSNLPLKAKDTDTQSTPIFQYQTCTNTVTTQGNDAYLVAQVERNNPNRADQDRDIVLSPTTPISRPSGLIDKSVRLPFHHLTAKVRFGIYTTARSYEDTKLPITNVTITATPTSGDYTTSANSYSATLDPSTSTTSFLQGTFAHTATATGQQTLLTLTDPSTLTLSHLSSDKQAEVKDNNLNNHYWDGTSSSPTRNAYFFGCPDGMIQIPQSDIEFHVSFQLGNVETFKDVKLTIKDEAGNITQDKFNWLPNQLYTYYIVIGDLPYDISFTATVAGWDDIEGNLTTDLEQ